MFNNSFVVGSLNGNQKAMFVCVPIQWLYLFPPFCFFGLAHHLTSYSLFRHLLHLHMGNQKKSDTIFFSLSRFTKTHRYIAHICDGV